MRLNSARRSDWILRSYERRDEAQTLDLFRQAFGREMKPEVWRWKLGPSASAALMQWVAVASDGDRVISYLGGIPIRLKLAGEIRDATISVDSMSAPGQQRSGLQAALFDAIHAVWKSAGMSVSLAVPNEKFGGLLIRQGWTRLFPLAWLQAPLHVESLLARKARLPRVLASPLLGLAGLGAAAWRRRQRYTPAQRLLMQVDEMREPSADFDRLWTNVESHYDNIVVRDSARIAWRYLSAPGFEYRVLLARRAGEPTGYIAYRSIDAHGRRTGLIADLLTAPADRTTAMTLLSAALDDLWSRGAELARATAPPASPLYKLLREAGFLRASGAFDFMILVLDPAVPTARLSDPARWLLTGGDFDVA